MDLSKTELPSTVEIVEVEVEWEQPQGKGLLGRAKAFANRTDVDLSVITFKGRSAVDYVDPKDHKYAHGGRVAHSGDVTRGTGEGGGERVKLELKNLRDKDSDLTAFAITASCSTGNFSKIAGATARIFDVTTGEKKQVDVIRFPVTSERTGALIALVRKTPTGWVVEEQQGVYGEGKTWRDLASLASHRL